MKKAVSYYFWFLKKEKRCDKLLGMDTLLQNRKKDQYSFTRVFQVGGANRLMEKRIFWTPSRLVTA